MELAWLGLSAGFRLPRVIPAGNPPPTCLQEVAFEESQKYKEGKYIVEKQRVMKVWRWSRLLTWAHSCVCWGRGRSS